MEVRGPSFPSWLRSTLLALFPGQLTASNAITSADVEIKQISQNSSRKLVSDVLHCRSGHNCVMQVSWTQVTQWKHPKDICHSEITHSLLSKCCTENVGEIAPFLLTNGPDQGNKDEVRGSVIYIEKILETCPGTETLAFPGKAGKSSCLKLWKSAISQYRQCWAQ